MCRKLNANEISVRIGQVKYDDAKKITGASLLLYKDARVDMKILDEMYGTFGWQKSYEKIGDSLFCKISVYDITKNQWISKEDVGTESNMEATKGEASDAFKRAGFRWGIGRELYTSPFVWIPSNKAEIKASSFNGKTRFNCYDKFSVEKIAYDEKTGRITGLAIRNDTKNRRAFVWQQSGRSLHSPRPSLRAAG